jgi:NAD+ synthase
MDYETLKESIVKWIKDWFDKNGKDCTAVIGISGGKDSTVTAALCKEALGSDRVLGVLMPNGDQSDIEDSYTVVKSLKIPYMVVNIGETYTTLENELSKSGIVLRDQGSTNLPPRLRMSTLYAIAQGVDKKTGKYINGRVANTCNLSETMVGWETRWGDQVGDFSPLGNLTKTQVVEIGKLYKDIPRHLIEKAPSDGLTGKTDEDNLGTTYEMIDRYIKDPDEDGIPERDRKIIEEKIKASEFKRKSINIPIFMSWSLTTKRQV